MMTSNFFILLILIVFLISLTSCRNLPTSEQLKEFNKSVENSTPIIGILTQEAGHFIDRKYPGHNYKSYIAASYVKFVEGSGARAVPIWIGQSRSYYENILSKINGILLPGGATFFNTSNGYAEAGRYIYNIAKNMNDNGNYLPIWGTCLGFELLTYLSTINDSEPRTYCQSQSQPLPLEFEKGYDNSRLFGKAPSNIIDILEKENVTANFHMYCVTKRTFQETGLDKEWKILSSNHDWNNLQFISTIEHYKYPFYGVQFHPEKNIYEFILNKNISHTANAIQVSQYFADFFINESRKNLNHFPTKAEENNNLIYNYSPLFTGRKGSAFEQQYLFEQYNLNVNVLQIMKKN